RLRVAGDITVTRPAAGTGAREPAGTVARPDRILRARDDADTADLHRRSGARRVRPAPHPEEPLGAGNAARRQRPRSGLRRPARGARHLVRTEGPADTRAGG